MEKLTGHLIPYFYSNHIVLEPPICGPWSKLRPESLQRRALEMVWWLTGGRSKERSTEFTKFKMLEKAASEAVRLHANENMIAVWESLLYLRT